MHGKFAVKLSMWLLHFTSINRHLYGAYSGHNVYSHDRLHHTFRTIWMSCIEQFVDLFHNLLTINKYRCMLVDIIIYVSYTLISIFVSIHSEWFWWAYVNSGAFIHYVCLHSFKFNFVYWIIKFKIRNKKMSWF